MKPQPICNVWTSRLAGGVLLTLYRRDRPRSMGRQGMINLCRIAIVVMTRLDVDARVDAEFVFVPFAKLVDVRAALSKEGFTVR